MMQASIDLFFFSLLLERHSRHKRGANVLLLVSKKKKKNCARCLFAEFTMNLYND